MTSRDERIIETTRIISEDEVPPEILAEIRRKEENHTDVKAKQIGMSFGTGLAAALVQASQKNDDTPVEPKKLGANVSALMSAGARLKADKNFDTKNNSQRTERIRDKAKNLTAKFLKGHK